MTGTRSDLLKSTGAMLATPNSASMALGVGSGSQVRPKNLFYVRFQRPALSGSNLWKTEVGFICKAVEKPAIEPQIEELSQYGKKNVIYTGIKYNPITLTLYDTTDNLALQMWIEYARYYFGAFNQTDISAWQDDSTSATMSGAKAGFGYRTRPAGTIPTDSLNTQFFFERMQIFDVFGGSFTQTDLIHPKISAFTPDPVDYEDSAPSTIRLTLYYEGVMYANDGKPQSIYRDQSLAAVFGNEFSGQVIDLPGESVAIQRNAGSFDFLDEGTSIYDGDTGYDDFRETNRALGDASRILSDVFNGTGVLSKFGNYNFGSVAPSNYNASPDIQMNTAQQRIQNANYLGSSGGTDLLSFQNGIFLDGMNSIPSGVGDDTADLAFNGNAGQSVNLSLETLAKANATNDGTVQMGKRV